MYKEPAVVEYGTIGSVTDQLDKIGSQIDDQTSTNPDLDGVIHPDS